MAGHVFITQADITKLRCDAWLLPTDFGFGVTRGFRSGLQDETARYLEDLYRDRRPVPAEWISWPNETVRAFPVPSEILPTDAPRIFLGNIGGTSNTSIEWFIEGAVAFLEMANKLREDLAKATRRPRPLLALPVVGIGQGGAHLKAGNVLKALLPALHEQAARLDVDIVLVTYRRSVFIAAQNARRQLFQERPARRRAAWSALTEEQQREATRLAELARASRLVLFIGAGVSVGAGLPTWSGLIDKLCESAGMVPDERERITSLNVLDQGWIVSTRLQEQGKRLADEIAAHSSGRWHALAHSQLAALPITEVVTTNYDNLFELASTGAGQNIAVLPYEPVTGRDRWLLKMHGCAERRADIVLTREDYLRYAERRAALAGIVQALLITRHMLFVGFSLTDDNFHRIADDVRRAIRGDYGSAGNHPARERHPFGTALFFRRNDLVQEIWSGDLQPVNITDKAELTRAETAEAARTLDIFLDYLLAEATRDASPLLDPTFDGVLSPEELRLQVILKRLDEDTRGDRELRESPAWEPVEDLLRRFGAEGAAQHRQRPR